MAAHIIVRYPFNLTLMANMKSKKKAYKFSWREGNQFDVLIDGTEFYPRMLDAIESAKRYILLEMYLFESGKVADRFINALLTAANQGVRVYLLLDDYGSLDLKQPDRDRLSHPNIQTMYYNPLQSHNQLALLYRIFRHHIVRSLYRDHRKLLLIDGKIAFVGGAGITDNFDPPDPGDRWRETMVEIQGPVLGDWQQIFEEGWNRYARQELELPFILPAEITDGQLGRVTVNEAQKRQGMKRSLYKRIHDVNHRYWLATAYFLPTWRLRRRLMHAARSGVDVRVLLPGSIIDHPWVRYASHRYYGRLLRQGVRIFEYQPRFFHAKMSLGDNWVSIGSCNFDRWNILWNLEANQEIDDQYIAKKVKAIFEKDFESSLEITYDEWINRNWYARFLEWLFHRFEMLLFTIRQRRHK